MRSAAPGRLLTVRGHVRSMSRAHTLSEMSFLLSLFAIIEHVNKSELTTTSKKLIIAYVNEASEKTATLDHLVLKLEYEASRLKM